MKTIPAFLISLTLCAAAACGGSVTMQAPAGFAELDNQKRYVYRATNAQGVVIGVRREANQPRGDQSFWSGAVDAHLRRAGYTAVTGSEVKTTSGLTGKQVRYTIVRNNREHAFWVTVFVTDESVITVEVGGDRAFFDDLEAPLATAIESLALD